MGKIIDICKKTLIKIGPRFPIFLSNINSIPLFKSSEETKVQII
jgi:hypothetical protein